MIAPCNRSELAGFCHLTMLDVDCISKMVRRSFGVANRYAECEQAAGGIKVSARGNHLNHLCVAEEGAEALNHEHGIGGPCHDQVQAASLQLLMCGVDNVSLPW